MAKWFYPNMRNSWVDNFTNGTYTFWLWTWMKYRDSCQFVYVALCPVSNRAVANIWVAQIKEQSLDAQLARETMPRLLFCTSSWINWIFSWNNQQLIGQRGGPRRSHRVQLVLNPLISHSMSLKWNRNPGTIFVNSATQFMFLELRQN